MTDLFPDLQPLKTDEELRRWQRNAPKGYATRPGTGPVGETCGTCKHACRVPGGGKTYHKCALVQPWTHGLGTDIKLSSPACQKFKPWRDCEEYQVLLALLTRAPKDCELRSRDGIVASEKSWKQLEKFLWVIPTEQERALLRPGMRIAKVGELCRFLFGKCMVKVSKLPKDKRKV